MFNKYFVYIFGLTGVSFIWPKVQSHQGWLTGSLLYNEIKFWLNSYSPYIPNDYKCLQLACRLSLYTLWKDYLYMQYLKDRGGGNRKRPRKLLLNYLGAMFTDLCFYLNNAYKKWMLFSVWTVCTSYTVKQKCNAKGLFRAELLNN